MEREYVLSIADVRIGMLHDREDLLISDRFLPFVQTSENKDFHVRFHTVASLPQVAGDILYADNCFDVYRNVRVFCRSPQDRRPYAVGSYDWDANFVEIQYLEDGADNVSTMENSFYHTAWEGMLLRKKRLVFHAACVNTMLGGILFSGPSGIGKSTQAALWCQHRGACLINGDRPILQKRDGTWLAWGAPYAGSSHIHLNENVPVSAIVMLRQMPECSVRRLGLREAFRMVFSQTTLNSWDAESVETASALVLELIQELPVLELCCTPDRQAVEILEAQLKKVTEHA